jgi:sec-independent protein translocase protein TatA
MFSIWHWMIVLVVVVLLFGSGKIVKLAGEIGQAFPAFKRGIQDAKDLEREVKKRG